jgi:hypothetical protein
MRPMRRRTCRASSRGGTTAGFNASSEVGVRYSSIGLPKRISHFDGSGNAPATPSSGNSGVTGM